MRRGLVIVAIAGALLGGVQERLDAQFRPWQITIAGGPSMPTGDFADEANLGYHVQGSVGFGVFLLPFDVRADALWQEFPAEGDGWWRQIGGLVNATFGIPMILVRPYALLGGGYVRTSAPDDGHGHEDENHVTLNAGLGVDFPFAGLRGVLEARYLGIAGTSGARGHQAIPISLGIKF